MNRPGPGVEGSGGREAAGRLARWLIGGAVVVVPPVHRERWEREWDAELWHRERRLDSEGIGGIRRAALLIGPALGAFVHAGWLRLQRPGLDALRQDVRFALRTYRRSPGFVAAAVATLGLGIAANVAVFAVIEGAFLEPYGYGEADRLGVLGGSDAERPGEILPLSIPDLEEVRESGVFQSVMAADWDPFNVRLDDRTEWVGGGLVSASMFETLGIEPLRGRGFAPDEDGAGGPRVVVLGEAFWRRELGGAEVVGRSLSLDGEPYEIIGVAPAAVDIPEGAELWVPLRPTGERLTRRSNWLSAYARLAPDVTWEGAGASLDVLSARIAAAHPETNEGRSITVESLRDRRTGGLKPAFLALAGAVGVLLLIVCANLASLMLARSARRATELGVRRALGASRGRVARQLITESLALAALGGACGLLVGGWSVRGLGQLVAVRPVWFVPDIDASVAWVAFGLTLASAVIFGIAPIRAASRQAFDSLAGASRGSTGRRRDVLVFAQVALSTVLLIAAGLLVRSLSELTSVDPGFDARGRVSGTIQLPDAEYDTDELVTGFVDRLIVAVEARPEIARAAAVTRMPFRSGTNSVMWWEEGQDDEAYRRNPQALLNSVTPGYFEALGIDITRGRALDPRDDGDAEAVAVISEAFARGYFGDRDPVGAHISFSYPTRFVTVVGVVADTRHVSLEQEPRYQIYAPFAQRPTTRVSIAVQAASPGATGPAAQALRDVVRSVEPDVAVAGLAPVEAALSASVWRLRLLTRVFWAFGAFALLLSAVGIAGVVATSVARRTREIGVRVALGARPTQVIGLVGRHTAALVAGGVVTGAGVALVLGRVAEGTLYGVEPRDPLTFAVVVAAFTAVGAVAALLPARRAMAIDPADALRAD
ncbi:MAG: ABC transporter permease [Gemmatimonadota bacterium]|nr:ABC transporter permease [Gemmatimonadota bacterium]